MREEQQVVNTIEVEATPQVPAANQAKPETHPHEHKTIHIKNMVCESCERIIEKSLEAKLGVKHVKASYKEGHVKVTFDPKEATLEQICKVIKDSGYKPIHKAEESDTNNEGNKSPAKKYAAIGLLAAAILIIAYFASNALFGSMNLSIPQLDPATGVGVVLIIGLLTGFHCIGMCGPFVLSYTAKARKENPNSLNLSLHAQYSAGKIISYTLIGGLFGLLGSVFVFSPELRAGIAIIAGIFLIIYSLKMLNVHPVLRKFSIPQSVFNKVKVGPLKSDTNPLLIGLANGLFIACGPLQAMYILAMATGSFFVGGMLLFAFAIGTLIPMMGFGIFASFISRGMQNNIVKISAIIVGIMGILMINNGLALMGGGVNLNSFTNTFTASGANAAGNAQLTNTDGNFQIIRMDVTNNGWEPNTFVLKKDVPVKWIINGKQLNGCNNGIIVKEYGLNFSIKQGEQTVEFTPTRAGTVQWSCWMGMIRGTFIVKENAEFSADGKINIDSAMQAEINKQATATPKSTSCGCGAGTGGTCSMSRSPLKT